MTSARTARVVALASGTMASRVTGFLRTLVAAYVLGFTPFADAFNLANTLPNSLYDLVIGGVVSATFVTVFTHRLTVDGDRKAWRSISTVASFTLLLLIAATFLVWLFAPYVVDAMTSLHHLDPRRTAEQLAQQRPARFQPAFPQDDSNVAASIHQSEDAAGIFRQLVIAIGDAARACGAGYKGAKVGKAGWMNIFSFQTSGASWWTLLPSESTATVTGMSSTVNS